MIKLSTGDDSTLGNYLLLCRIYFGNESLATKWVEEKIAAARNGEAEEVLADEAQVVNMLAQLNAKTGPNIDT